MLYAYIFFSFTTFFTLVFISGLHRNKRLNMELDVTGSHLPEVNGGIEGVFRKTVVYPEVCDRMPKRL